MKVLRFSRQSAVWMLHTSSGEIRLAGCPGGIHVRYWKEPAATRLGGWMVDPPASEVELRLEESPGTLTFRSPDVTLIIDRSTGRFAWYSPAGTLLTHEPPPCGKLLKPIVVHRAVVGQTVTSHTIDGVRSKAIETEQVLDRQAYHTKLSFQFQPDEAIYGLGQHDQGDLNLRGKQVFLFQQNTKVAMPFIVSTRNWGVLLDTYSLTTFHDDGHGSYLWTDVDDELEYYFLAADSPAAVVGRLRQLTGKAVLLPKWAFGYVQSKERYKTQDELVDTVAEYRRREIPIDVIVQDWCTWRDGMWGEKHFDPSRFPDPPKLMRQLHDQHAHLLVSIWPNIRGGEDAKEMAADGFFLGNGLTYDAFNPAARDLYWQQANRGYFRYGVDGWWCDCTEPFEADWTGAVKPEPWQQMLTDTAEFKKYLDPEIINAYSLLHSRGLYENQLKEAPDKRMCNLTRSAYIGQQRYGTITWSGDVDARWETLRKQIPAGLNFCATGSPYWTTDIGAFFVKHNPEKWFWRGDFDAGVNDLGYRELYLRWFQFATFLPMFRSHGTDTPREVWQFGRRGEVFYDTLVKFIELRYRLMPYLYSLFGWSYHRDETPMRPVAFDFASDPQTHDLKDQFLLGPALMACPVIEPMRYGPGSTPLEGLRQSRGVYLPDGADWYDFWTGRRLAGGRWVDADAPLEIMPLFVRAGSILPMSPVTQYVDQQPEAAWDLRVYRGADGAFDLYEDAGEGLGYQHGQFATTALRWSDAAEKLTIGDRAGSYPSAPPARQYNVVEVSEGIGAG